MAVVRVKFGHGSPRGSNRSVRDFVRAEFIGRTFYVNASNRTECIRLFMDALRPCIDPSLKTRISKFLKRFGLSFAERIAILQHLGYTHSSSYLSRMSVAIGAKVDVPPKDWDTLLQEWNDLWGSLYQMERE